MDKPFIFFVDDNFTSHIAQAKDLMRRLASLKIKWVSQASIHAAHDEEFLRLARESGCQGLLVGLESLNPDTLKRMSKTFNMMNGGFDVAFANLRKYGIRLYITFMMGYDGEGVEEALPRHAAPGRRLERGHRVVEGQQPHRVVLAMSQPRERRGQPSAVVKLRRFFAPESAPEPHRRAHVEHQHEAGVGLALEALDVRAARARVGVPVHEARVVAGHVVAIFRELLAEAEHVGPVQPVQHAVHHRARHEFQVAEPGQDLRRDQARRRARPGACVHPGSRTPSSTSAISASTVTPSDSAR